MEDIYTQADRQLASLKYRCQPDDINFIGGGMYMAVPDTDFETCFRPRWTKNPEALMRLIHEHRVSIYFYEDRVTVTLKTISGMTFSTGARFSSHKDDELALAYAVVSVVSRKMEAKKS